jgi:predicted ATP-dependent endonuclease of OLD family
MIFSLAKQLNIQVFATTHSWDCIQSFTEVAIENEQMNGTLLKIGKSKLSKNKGMPIVTIFNEKTSCHYSGIGGSKMKHIPNVLLVEGSNDKSFFENLCKKYNLNVQVKVKILEIF